MGKTIEESVKYWLEAVQSQDWKRREQAAKDLQSHPEEVVAQELFNRFLQPGSFGARSAAMDGLERFGQSMLPNIRKAIVEGNNKLYAINLIGRMQDPGALPFLYQALEDQDINNVQAAIESLGLIGVPSAAPRLFQMLDEDPWLALAAIDALGLIGGESVVRELENRIDNPDTGPEILLALGKTGNERQLESLAKRFFENTDPLINDPLIEAIGMVAMRHHNWPTLADVSGSDAVLDDLRKGLHIERDGHIAGSLFLLGQVGVERDIRSIVRMVNVPSLEQTALRALRIIGQRFTHDFELDLRGFPSATRLSVLTVLDELGKLENAVESASTDASSSVRRVLATLLTNHLDEWATEALVDLVWDQAKDVGEIAIQALSTRRISKASTTRLKESIARMPLEQALGLFEAVSPDRRKRVEDVFEPIVSKLMQSDNQSRAVRVLKTIHGPEAKMHLVEMYENAKADPRLRYEILDAMAGQLDASHIGWIRQQMQDPDPIVKPLCIQILRSIPETPEEIWIKLLESKEREILGWVIAEIVKRKITSALPRIKLLYSNADTFLKRAILQCLRAFDQADQSVLLNAMRHDHWSIRLEGVRTVQQWDAVPATMIGTLQNETHPLVVQELSRNVRDYLANAKQLPADVKTRLQPLITTVREHAQVRTSVTEGLWS